MIKIIIQLIKSFFCRHRIQTFVRNIHGDEVIQCGYKRSVWRCNNCGAVRWHKSLYRENIDEVQKVGAKAFDKLMNYCEKVKGTPAEDEPIPKKFFEKDK